MSVMNIYACGGAGANVASNFLKFSKKKESGFAQLVPYFIDTSKSNINSAIPQDQTFLVDGLDGSGKKRNANYETISECYKEILHTFKPADVNVVIHSASGGKLTAML